MDMSSTSMPASAMQMVFFTSTTTPLLSAAWVPQTTGQYAGTCIALIALAAIFRGLFAYKSQLERRWAGRARRRPRVVVAGSRGEARGSGRRDDVAVLDGDDAAAASGVDAEKAAGVGRTLLKRGSTSTSGNSSDGTRVAPDLAASGSSTVPAAAAFLPEPWRLSVDLPRACVVTVMVGLGYLL